MTTLSVLIVSYRTPRLTLAAVRSALAAPIVRQVIVVDNDSRDETADLLLAVQDERLQLVVNATNEGYGRAANHAVSLATGEILIFLNSDAEISPAAAAGLAEEVERHYGGSMVAPRLIDSDGNVQRSAGLLPGPLDLAVRALGLNYLGTVVARAPLLGTLYRRSRLAQEYNSALVADAPLRTNMVTGACVAIDRETFERLGGFDERFFLYFEDADLCRRALRSGVAIWLIPSLSVRHVGGASSVGEYHFSPVHARSMRQYLEKWWGPGGAALALLLLWLRLVGHAITFRPGTRRAFRALRAAMG